jgi:hypothetical protein
LYRDGWLRTLELEDDFLLFLGFFSCDHLASVCAITQEHVMYFQWYTSRDCPVK